MLDELEQQIANLRSLNTKLILLVGSPGSGKTKLFEELAERQNASVVRVGSELGRKLLSFPSTRRHLEVAGALKEITVELPNDELLLLDNIELFFDKSLRLDPLDFLKRQSHSRNVVAAWPGELSAGRLTYAAMGHPEHQGYDAKGLVVLNMH